MGKIVVKFWDKVIVMLLGIAGVFSGCKPDVTGECEPNLSWNHPYSDSLGWAISYGMLSADFAIRGTVTSKTDGKPIPNIAVFRQMENNQTEFMHLTGSEGNYYVDYRDMSDKENVIRLKLEDIDGKENGGNFATQEIKVKITNAERDKMKQCQQDNGTFTKTQNIELKKKK